MKHLNDFVSRSQCLETIKKGIKTSVHLLRLERDFEKSATFPVYCHRNLLRDAGDIRSVGQLSERCREVRERNFDVTKARFNQIVMMVHRSVEQVFDIPHFFLRQLAHREPAVRPHYHNSSLHRRGDVLSFFESFQNPFGLPSSHGNAVLSKQIHECVCSSQPQFVGAYLELKQLFVPLLLALVNDARLHDGVRSGADRHNASEKGLEVEDYISPRVAPALVFDGPRLTPKDRQNQSHEHDDEEKYPDHLFVISRHDAPEPAKPYEIVCTFLLGGKAMRRSLRREL